MRDDMARLYTFFSSNYRFIWRSMDSHHTHHMIKSSQIGCISGMFWLELLFFLIQSPQVKTRIVSQTYKKNYIEIDAKQWNETHNVYTLLAEFEWSTARDHYIYIMCLSAFDLIVIFGKIYTLLALRNMAAGQIVWWLKI